MHCSCYVSYNGHPFVRKVCELSSSTGGRMGGQFVGKGGGRSGLGWATVPKLPKLISKRKTKCVFNKTTTCNRDIDTDAETNEPNRRRRKTNEPNRRRRRRDSRLTFRSLIRLYMSLVLFSRHEHTKNTPPPYLPLSLPSKFQKIEFNILFFWSGEIV